MNHFKTQQEIWKYVADGGAVKHFKGAVVSFNKYGHINAAYYDFAIASDWQPYIEPVPKTKVWRWEIVRRDYEKPTLRQTFDLFSEEDAAKHYPGYTKVPNSEREI